MNPPRPIDAPNRHDLVAFYGSLMSGFEAPRSLGIESALRFRGPCLCVGQLYDLGDYPGLRRGPGRVVAELYEVIDLGAVETLDEFEGFDPRCPEESLYLRERIRLLEPVDTEAWIYVYNHPPDVERQILSGDWRRHLATQAGSQGR